MAEAPTVAEIRALLSQASGRRLARLIAEHADDPRAGVQSAVASARNRHGADSLEAARMRSLYALETELRDAGATVVVGIDEVGRGALAGPLTACAVILPLEPRIADLDDSKRLVPERRAEVAARVREVALGYHVMHVEAPELDALGMTAALRRAFLGSIAGLGVEPDHVLVDGLPTRSHPKERAIVKGDSKVAAIAAASCVAKVARDTLMREMADAYPVYGFEIHKGYSTPGHLEAIRVHGLCPLHRRSFAPCGGTMSLF